MISDIWLAQDCDHKVKSGIIIKIPEVSNELEMNSKWLAKLQGWCADSVICRTVHSYDNYGQPISKMSPYREHLLCISLPPDEKQVHEYLIQQYLESGTSEMVKNRKVRVIAFLHGRLRADPFLGILPGLAHGPRAFGCGDG